MSFEIRIPALGAGMSEGTLVEWLAADGEAVAPGALLYTLESEKTAQEVEAPVAGVLRHAARAGEVYPVGELIGTIE
ncbi:MAG TPA: lipoyl domain-containing protein [Phenylobacterium sp.]|nr:lipoyl domain-containing protein [Phenylobacterium sp.]